MTDYVDSEGAVREWTRGRPRVATLVDGRVYFAVPEQTRPTLPMVVEYRVGGSPDSHGHDYPRIVFECWGENKHQASQLAKELAAEIQDSQEQAPVNVTGGVVVSGEVTNGPVPMGGTSYAKRYRVDATFMVRAA